MRISLVVFGLMLLSGTLSAQTLEGFWKIHWVETTSGQYKEYRADARDGFGFAADNTMQEVVMMPGKLDIRDYQYVYEPPLLTVMHSSGVLSWHVEYIADDELLLTGDQAKMKLLRDR